MATEKQVPTLILSNADIPRELLSDECVFLGGLPILSQPLFWKLRGAPWRLWADLAFLRGLYFSFPALAAPGSLLRRSMLGPHAQDPQALRHAISSACSGPEFITRLFYPNLELFRFWIDAHPSHAFAAKAFLDSNPSHRFIGVPVDLCLAEGEKSRWFGGMANENLRIAASTCSGQFTWAHQLDRFLPDICSSNMDAWAPHTLLSTPSIVPWPLDENARVIWPALVGKSRAPGFEEVDPNDSSFILREAKRMLAALRYAAFRVAKEVLRTFALVLGYIVFPAIRLIKSNSGFSDAILESEELPGMSRKKLNIPFVEKEDAETTREALAQNISRQIRQISPHIPQAAKGRFFAVAIAFTGRHDLVAKICRLLLSYEKDQTLVLVGSSMEDQVFGNALVNEHGARVVFFQFPNAPLGSKWQFAASASRLLDPRTLVILGSDDLLGPAYYQNAKKLVSENEYKAEYVVYGLRSWTMYDLSGDPKFSGFPWRFKYNVDLYPTTLGAGRMYSRAFLDTVDWTIFRMDWQKNLDGFGELQAYNYGSRVETLPPDEFPLLSIKKNHEVLNKTANLIEANYVLSRPLDFSEHTVFRDTFPGFFDSFGHIRTTAR